VPLLRRPGHAGSRAAAVRGLGGPEQAWLADVPGTTEDKARCVPTSLTYHVGASANFDGYKTGQPMARVFEYESNADDPDILAEQAFMLFNADPGGFQNLATGPDLGFYAARSYSLMRPSRTGRRWIRFLERSAAG
jgi:hypothetical protein